MVVVNRVISRKNAPTMKANIEQISKTRKGEKLRRHMLHGMTMRYLPLTLLMMNKQTFSIKHLYPVACVLPLQSKVTTIINYLKPLMKLMKKLTD